MFFEIFFIIILFLCYGSFLNVVAYRSIHDIPFLQKRSICPNCKKLIYWYDNIPVLSWIFLMGKCRNCKKYISFLYLFIEIISTIIFTSLFLNIFLIEKEFFLTFQTITIFLAYFVFFSALIISTRTDLEEMVIPQIFSIYLVPIGMIFSFCNFTEISIESSIFGAIFGYTILWITAKLFTTITKKDGLGVGDMELLAMIGSFLGPIGAWFSLTIGSIIGLLICSIYIFMSKKDASTQIPFGPFIALGATTFYFFKEIIIKLFLF